MREVKMSKIIDRSFFRTSNILFDHFSMKTWLKLAFIAFFAGSLFSSSWNYNSNDKAKDSSSGSKSLVVAQKAGSASGTSAFTNESEDKIGIAPSSSGPQAVVEQKTWQERIASLPKIVWYVIPTILIFLLFFMLIFMWTGSRFQFIWFHAIATRDVTIVEPFHRHRSQGNSLFKANLLLSLIGWTFILCFGTYFFYLAYGAGAFKPEFTWSAVFVLKLMAGPLIFLLIFVLAAIFINVMIEHFVVSVMALDKVSFLPAFRKVWGIFKTNKKDTALFYLLLFIMSVISVVIALIVTILGVIVVALAGVLVFGLGYLLFVTAMKAMPVFIIYCIVLGAPILAVAFLLIIFIRVPLAVFFRSYSIEFLYALNCGYSEESLENYEKDKSGERSKTFIWAPVLIIFLFIAVAFVGMLAAIAIPNFVKARDQARARAVATTQSSTANPGNSSSTIS